MFAFIFDHFWSELLVKSLFCCIMKCFIDSLGYVNQTNIIFKGSCLEFLNLLSFDWQHLACLKHLFVNSHAMLALLSHDNYSVSLWIYHGHGIPFGSFLQIGIPHLENTYVALTKDFYVTMQPQSIDLNTLNTLD